MVDRNPRVDLRYMIAAPDVYVANVQAMARHNARVTECSGGCWRGGFTGAKDFLLSRHGSARGTAASCVPGYLVWLGWWVWTMTYSVRLTGRAT